MAVPTSITDLSTTAASNSPAGSDSIGTSLDDYLRSIQAILKQTQSQGTDITAAATITPAADGSYFTVNGSTGITAIGSTNSWNGREIVLRFASTPTITHNGSSLILPGSANITAAAGDVAAFVQESSGVWRCTGYVKADGTAIAGATQSAIQTQSYTRFTAGGTADAITGTLAPAIGSYVAGLRVTTTPGGANTVTGPTLNLNGLGVKTIKKRSSTGSKVALVAGDYNASGPFNIEYDGTDFILLDPVPASASSSVQIQPISASVGSNALTISASALSIDFRSATLGSGTVTTVSGTPSNLVISSGSTLGTVNAIQSRIAVLAINNAGTIEIAAVNTTCGLSLDETGLISTTAEGGAGAADSATTIYSTTARTNVAYRVIGYIESTQATAGTWATAPSTIQGAGGQSLQRVNSICNGTTVSTTSGTSIDFTSIPSWVKRITIMLNGVSTNGTSNVILQLGAGSIDAASYSGASQQGGSPQAYSTGFLVSTSALAASVRHGSLTLTHMGSNVWAFNGNIADTNSTWCVSGAGVKALSGTLDRVRLTTVGGTDTFDAGSVNILFE